MAADTGRERGAVAARDTSTSKQKWLLPLALLLLAVIALGIFLLLRNRNDDQDKKGLDVKDDKSGQLAPSVPKVELPSVIHV